MFFTIPNKKYLSPDQLRANTMLDAYFVVQNYPMHASDLILDNYIQQQYKTSLKNLCIKLLLKLTFYKDDTGNLILLFKDPKDDLLARLVTYGNGALPGSNILKSALNN